MNRGLDSTLSEASAALERGEISAEALVDAAIARIERTQPRLNTFIRQDFTAARQAALRRDREPRRGPLHGIPLAHKDMFDRAGAAVSGGSRILGERMARRDAAVLAALDGAGALDLGGLNMSEFAAGPTGANPHFGRCGNPWNPAHATGGSSSGSAAAVAARQIFGALGSDTGGSIRIPAALCGVVGLKPTAGLVSRRGAMPRVWSQDVIGPIARTAEDCALLLQPIAGYDPADGLSVAFKAPDYLGALEQPLAGTVVGVPDGYFENVSEGALGALIEDAAGVLERLGCTLRPVPAGAFEDVLAAAEIVHLCEASALHARWLRQRPDDYGTELRARLEDGLLVPAVSYLEALSLRAPMLSRVLGETFAASDVLLTPTVPCTAPSYDALEKLAPDQAGVVIRQLTRNTRPFSFLGLPAISVPCGRDGSGLPFAFQLAARPFDEALLLALAHQFQRDTDHHRTAPPLA